MKRIFLPKAQPPIFFALVFFLPSFFCPFLSFFLPSTAFSPTFSDEMVAAAAIVDDVSGRGHRTGVGACRGSRSQGWVPLLLWPATEGLSCAPMS